MSKRSWGDRPFNPSPGALRTDVTSVLQNAQREAAAWKRLTILAMRRDAGNITTTHRELEEIDKLYDIEIESSPMGIEIHLVPIPASQKPRASRFSDD